MLAITLWPEWAWAICYLGKATENRSWYPPRELIGRRLAIHAGAYVGGRKAQAAAAEAVDAVSRMAGFAGWRITTHSDRRGPFAIEAVRLRERAATTFAADGPHLAGFGSVPTSAVVAVATLASVDDEDRTPWDVPGEWHWRLADVVVLDRPVPMRGAQGLWHWTPALDGRDDVR